MTLDLSPIYSATCTVKLADLLACEAAIKTVASIGADVTGAGPVYLYRSITKTLHGTSRTLTMTRPSQGRW